MREASWFFGGDIFKTHNQILLATNGRHGHGHVEVYDNVLARTQS